MRKSFIGKLILLFFVGVLAASCGSDNTVGSAGSSTSPGTSYDSACIDELDQYVESNYYTNQNYSSVDVYFAKASSGDMEKKCKWGFCVYTQKPTQSTGSKTVQRHENKSTLYSLIDQADSCTRSGYLTEIRIGTDIVHFNRNMPPEANPVRVIQMTGNNTYSDYYMIGGKVWWNNYSAYKF